MEHGLTFGLLGPVEVVHRGRVVPVRSGKQRVLLAALLAGTGEVVPVEALVHYLWGDTPPSAARNTLQNHVLRLRRSLRSADGSTPVRSHPGGYSIDVPREAVDIHRLEPLLNEARRAGGDPDRAAELLRDALRLWRGRPLVDVDSEALQAELRPVLEERRLDLLEERIEIDLRLGRHRGLLPELRDLTARHPLVERFWAQRIVALCRSGRPGEALACYHSAARTLAEELGADPGPELKGLHRVLLDTGSSAPAYPAAGNLPAEVTSFVGRQTHLERARCLLATARILTLTGIGGVGKTRLALQLASAASRSFPDGTWLVDLTPLRAPELLGRTVAEQLGVPDAADPATLGRRLRGRELLLVLDNCDHVVDAVGELTAELAHAVPGLTVLITSRRTLGVPGEHVLHVPPLDLPGTDGPVEASEAVRLLVDRVSAVLPAFELDDRNRQVVARLCRRLDGIPLAIELAAVRLAALSVEDVLDRLDLLDGPAPERTGSRTLREVLDWSYELCSDPERRMWERVSVFAGEFDLAAAEAVCAGGPVAVADVADLLARLVHQSVVVADPSGDRSRYRLLDTVRRYGLARLRAVGGEAQVRARHHLHYRRLAARSAGENCGSPDEVTCQQGLERDEANLREAMEFGRSRPELAPGTVEMAVDLSRAAFFTGRLSESRYWLARTLDTDVPLCRELHVRATAFQAWVAVVLGDADGARALLGTCGDAPGGGASAAVLFARGNLEMFARSSPEAIDLLAEARERYRTLGNLADGHMATVFWAMAAVFLGPADAAVAAAAECLAEARALGAPWTVSWATWTTGLAELRHGDADRAVVLLEEALTCQRDVGDRWGPLWSTEVLGWAEAARGEHGSAAALLDTAARQRREAGVELVGLFRETHTAVERLVRG